MELNLKYYGLTTEEKLFIQSIHDKTHAENIRGKNVFPIFQNINKVTEAISVEDAIKLIEEDWKKEEETFSGIFKGLE